MSETPTLKLPVVLGEQEQKHVPMNEALRVLDCVVQLSVRDRDLTAPPASPSDGDRYLVAAPATGDWIGRDLQVAVWQATAWAFQEPNEGWLAWVEDEAALVVYDGTDWVSMSTFIAELQELALVGIGTTADATNPFAAKLNKALWTAKYAADGGDGDLRYTLNKESAGDTVSLLFQRGFSGRAEIGLIGDDDLTLKVSPDGSSWMTAMVVGKTTGALLATAGLAAAPAVAIGEAGTGFHRPATGKLGVSLSGSEVARLTTTGLGLGNAGFDPDAQIEARVTGGGAASMLAQAEGIASLIVRRVTGDAAAATNNVDKARGTIASPAIVASNDQVGRYMCRAYNGTSFTPVSRVDTRIIEPSPGAAALGARWQVDITPLGSATTTEVMRLEPGTGLSMFGANPVVDQNRHLRLRSYTIATLPSASPAGQMIHCSDLGGGSGQLNSDGTAWRRVSRGGQQAVATDAAFTLTALACAEEQRHTGTLTANRAVTLSATNAYAGARFRVARTGGGAFNLDIGGLKTLATDTWCEVVHDGSAWYLAACGAL